jgi:hypothetical protein
MNETEHTHDREGEWVTLYKDGIVVGSSPTCSQCGAILMYEER